MDMLNHIKHLVLSATTHQSSRATDTDVDCDTTCKQLLQYFILFVGLPENQLEKIQLVLNYAAHLIYGWRKYNHVTTTP